MNDENKNDIAEVLARRMEAIVLCDEVLMDMWQTDFEEITPEYWDIIKTYCPTIGALLDGLKENLCVSAGLLDNDNLFQAVQEALRKN